jgi:flagellar hook-associated protein 1 FlgK
MASTGDMLSIGKSALLTTQQGLATSSHNTANVSTPGYSRQSVLQEAQLPEATAGGYIGRGVQTTTIRRNYDQFLTSNERSTMAASENWQQFEGLANQIDQVFAQSETGLNDPLNGLFGSLYDLAQDPTSKAAREVVLTSADTLASRFNMLSNYLSTVQQEVNKDVTQGAADLNDLAAKVAELNIQILNASNQSASGPPNDLMDQRDRLLLEMSKLTEISVYQEKNGMINVYAGKGFALVLSGRANQLATSPDTQFPGHLRVVLDGGNGSVVDVTNSFRGGQLGGALDFQNQMLDPTRNKLDELAFQVAKELNGLNRRGYDASGRRSGNDIFQVTPASQGAASAIKLQLKDGSQLATATKRGKAGDNSNALAMAKRFQEPTMDNKTQNFAGFYAGMVGEAGAQARSAQINSQSYGILSEQASAARLNQAGVNLDEEAANLVRLQQEYSAAAQIIAVSDQVFQELINAVRR